MGTNPAFCHHACTSDHVRGTDGTVDSLDPCRPRPLRGRWSRATGRFNPIAKTSTSPVLLHRCCRTCRQTARRPSSEQRQKHKIRSSPAKWPAEFLADDGRLTKHTGRWQTAALATVD